MSLPLPIITNLATATFECSYGRGCEGLCCKNSEPPVTPAEQRLIADNLPRIVPHLRPKARAEIERSGFLGGLHDDGNPKLGIVEDWCVFFNRGCVLHKIGAAEGASFAYKPSACTMFPLEQNTKGEWYVRQWGIEEEEWDLFCLNPANSTRPAAQTLGQEIEYVGDLVRRDAVPPVLPFPRNPGRAKALDSLGAPSTIDGNPWRHQGFALRRWFDRLGDRWPSRHS